jgi:hypothetical protein
MLPIGDERREPRVVSLSRVLLERGETRVEIDLQPTDSDEIAVYVLGASVPSMLHVWICDKDGGGVDVGAIDAGGKLYGAAWAVSPACDHTKVDDDTAALVAARAIERLAKKWSTNPVEFAREVMRAHGEIIGEHEAEEKKAS